MSNPSKQRRWYDHDQSLSSNIEMLETFPPEIRTIIADGIVALAERECDANEILTSLKSLGADTILGLYKSKNKRRESDQDPNMHKAMNYLYVLSEENREFMAEQINNLIRYIHDYFKTCKDFDSDPNSDDIAQVTRTYVESGNDDVKLFLQNVQRQFESGIANRKVVQEDRSGGMKITKDTDPT